MRRLFAPVVLMAGLCGAAPAAAQVVTLRPLPGPWLADGPQLAGNQFVWSQQRCLAGCSIWSDGDTDTLYAIRAAGADGAARTLFRRRVSGSSSGPNYYHQRFSFVASEEALVTLRLESRGDEAEGESGGVVMRAGASGTTRPVLVQCSAPYFGGGVPVAVDGGRVAYDPDPCDELSRLVVRDLGTGATLAVPEPAGGDLVSLRGRFVAWIEGGRLVVHDLTAGTTAYSAPAAGVLAFDLDADGTVAAVSGRERRPCSTGRLLRYSPATPAPADLGAACATAVAIDASRIVYLRWQRPFRTLSEVGDDGAPRGLVRFGRARPGEFDFAAGRIAWAARDCGGGEAIFTASLADAPLGAGSIYCRARFGSGTVPVRRGVATMMLRCPRGCGGEASLRNMGRRRFSLLRGETEVRIRLRRHVRARLERLGALPARAKIVTYNLAGDRHARSRQVTLVSR